MKEIEEITEQLKNLSSEELQEISKRLNDEAPVGKEAERRFSDLVRDKLECLFNPVLLLTMLAVGPELTALSALETGIEIGYYLHKKKMEIEKLERIK